MRPSNIQMRREQNRTETEASGCCLARRLRAEVG